MINFEKSLNTAKNLYLEENYQASVRESGTILENSLKKLLNNILLGKNNEDKQVIIKAEAKIGNGKTTIASMGLGQVIGVFRSCDGWSIVRKMVKDNCSFINKIDFDEMCELRNRAVHNPNETISGEEAYEDFYLPVRRMLHKLELIGDVKSEAKVSKDKAKPLTSCMLDDCDFPLDETWKYCPSCGNQTSLFCTHCDEELNAKMKICPYCETHVTKISKKEKETNIDELRILVKGALLDNIINKSEKALLESKRIELGITEEIYEELMDTYLSDEVKKYTDHLESIAIDGVVTVEEREYLDKKVKQLKLDPLVVKELEATYLP
jgi:hypothetical protein